MVATPIGNLGDLTQRAISALAAADIVLAEDTRKTGILFKRLGLSSPSFLSLFEHNEEKRIEAVLEHLSQGKDLALVSSAGTPLLSDPGYRIVRACRKRGFAVQPVPGPTAPAVALMGSGISPLPYTFLGFLPRKKREQERLLGQFSQLHTTLVFFERKSRLASSLETAYQCLGPREVCLGRELTKQHEEFIFFELGQWQFLPSKPQGEFTVVLGPPDPGREIATPREEVLGVLREERGSGEKPKRVVESSRERVKGWSKKDVYQLYLELEKDKGPGNREA